MYLYYQNNSLIVNEYTYIYTYKYLSGLLHPVFYYISFQTCTGPQLNYLQLPMNTWIWMMDGIDNEFSIIVLAKLWGE